MSKFDSLSPAAWAFYLDRHHQAVDAIEAARAAGQSGAELQLTFELEMKAAAGALWLYQDRERAAQQDFSTHPIRRRTAADATCEQERRMLAALDSVDERIRAQKEKARAAAQACA